MAVRIEVSDIAEIKKLVTQGVTVHAGNDGYRVLKDDDSFDIVYTSTGYRIGLHGAPGTRYATKLNASDFYYYGPEPREAYACPSCGGNDNIYRTTFASMDRFNPKTEGWERIPGPKPMYECMSCEYNDHEAADWEVGSGGE